jgi:hypothetical protein
MNQNEIKTLIIRLAIIFVFVSCIILSFQAGVNDTKITNKQELMELVNKSCPTWMTDENYNLKLPTDVWNRLPD